ncbi:hypothetical protein AB4232_21050, partial [Vibrio sp. 10N.286.46.A8]
MKELEIDDLEVLSELFGLKVGTFKKILKGDSEFKDKQIVSMIKNAMKNHSEDTLVNSIKPLVEFFEITHAESKRGASWEIIPTTRGGETRFDQIRNKLETTQGIYFFYDSAGKVIYAGKTETQGLWLEMKNAFNRDRASQNVYLASHPN